jgi:hypothetical protein
VYVCACTVKVYLVSGLTMPKNEINGALNVAALEIMPPLVIKEGVLCSIESTIVKGH